MMYIHIQSVAFVHLSSTIRQRPNHKKPNIYIYDLSFNVLLMIYVYVIYTFDIYMTKLATIATTTTPTRDVELFRHPKPS